MIIRVDTCFFPRTIRKHQKKCQRETCKNIWNRYEKVKKRCSHYFSNYGDNFFLLYDITIEKTCTLNVEAISQI